MKTLDLYLGVLPALASVSFFVLALAVFRLTGMYDKQQADTSKHNFWRQYYYWVLSPLIRGLDKLRITPNHVTYFSIVLALLSAALFATQHYFATFLFLLISCSCDVADGMLARLQGTSSESGAFLDSFMDRVVEGILFLGIAIAGGGGLLTWIAMITLVASFTVSYARAKGESLGVVASMGFMGRPARLVSLIFITLFMALFDWLAPPFFQTPQAAQTASSLFFAAQLALVAAGSMHTTFLRVAHIKAQLPQPAPRASSAPVQPGAIMPKGGGMLDEA